MNKQQAFRTNDTVGAHSLVCDDDAVSYQESGNNGTFIGN
jgi:hypothetical protein